MLLLQTGGVGWAACSGSTAGPNGEVTAEWLLLSGGKC